MLKNHKILLLVIVLATVGMLSVLGIWLANSYRQHSSFIVSQADQTLVSVFHDYLNDRDFPISRGRSTYHQRLANEITARYPQVDADTVLRLLNKNFESRQDTLRQRNRIRINLDRRKGGRYINPWFLQNREINVEVADLDTLSAQYRQELTAADMENLQFSLNIKRLPREKFQQYRESQALFATRYTRPVLIDQEQEIYFYASFEDLWQIIILKMVWQLLFALSLVLAFAGAFMVLFSTVRKQNKLATLQRTFVNNMTHELKTPISTVMAALEAIQRYGAKDDKARMEKYLALSKRELEHLTQIVERVLQFNANANNGIVLERIEFDLVNLARVATEGSLLSAAEGTSVKVVSSDDVIHIYADKSHVQNVVTNLIDNAIKYSVSPAQVTVTLSESGNRAFLSVEDKGIGIPNIYLKNVFDIFFRVPSGEIYNTKGFGIGLAYVKQVIDQHGGNIFVQSEEGKGSKFTITLPKNI